MANTQPFNSPASGGSRDISPNMKQDMKKKSQTQQSGSKDNKKQKDNQAKGSKQPTTPEYGEGRKNNDGDM